VSRVVQAVLSPFGATNGRANPRILRRCGLCWRSHDESSTLPCKSNRSR
jgi:hypothetical protein